MKSRSLHINTNDRKKIPFSFYKESRVVKAVKKSAETIVISGKTSAPGKKKFQFSVMTPQQQMRKRNSAYRFFSID